MKPFALEPGMTTMAGVFYPTGSMILMFPTEQDARAAARAIEAGGYSGEHISLLRPADIQEKIVSSVGSADIPLPSPGTEADTVRQYAKLAGLGHYALMIHAPSQDESERVMALLKDVPISYGQKYRHLVIQDLVEMGEQTPDQSGG